LSPIYITGGPPRISICLTWVRFTARTVDRKRKRDGAGVEKGRGVKNGEVREGGWRRGRKKFDGGGERGRGGVGGGGGVVGEWRKRV